MNGFIKLDWALMRTEAWQALSGNERALLIYIWAKHNGKNNGNIGCGRREVQKQFGCGEHTAVKWLRSLQEKGFIVATVRGSFNQKTGGGRTTRWRLIMEKFDGDSPTREYKSCRPKPAENSKRGCSQDTNIGCSDDTNMASTLVH
jgi:hypothetical protein